MTRAGAWAGFLLAMLLGLAEATPLFQRSTRVVLFVPVPSDPLAARIEAELAAVGIAVKRVRQPSDSQIEAVITREMLAGASAAIRIMPRSRGTEVWTGDTTAQVSTRRSIQASTSDAALSVVALRTVEFLRASLLEVKRTSGSSGGAAAAGRAAVDETAEIAGPPQPQSSGPIARVPVLVPAPPSAQPSGSPVAPSPPNQAPTAALPPPSAPDVVTTGRRSEGSEPAPGSPPPDLTPTPTPTNRSASVPVIVARPAPTVADHHTRAGAVLQLAVGPVVMASAGGSPPIGAIAAIVRIPIAGRLGAEAIAVFPVVPARIARAPGTIEVGVTLFGAAASFRLTPARGPWRADLALGGAATRLRAVGNGSGSVGTAPNLGSTEETWQLTGHLRLGAGYELSRWLTCRADLIAGAVASRIDYQSQVVDTARKVDPGSSVDYGSWGPAFAGVMLSLEAGW